MQPKLIRVWNVDCEVTIDSFWFPSNFQNKMIYFKNKQVRLYCRAVANIMRQRFSLINCYAWYQIPRVHTSQVTSVASFEPDHGGCTSVWPPWGETTGGPVASAGRCPGCRELTLESAPPIELVYRIASNNQWSWSALRYWKSNYPCR